MASLLFGRRKVAAPPRPVPWTPRWTRPSSSTPAPRSGSCPTRRASRSTTPAAPRRRSARSSRSAPTAANPRSTSGRRREAGGTRRYTVDHHHGSEENQPGWVWHDERARRPGDRPARHAPWSVARSRAAGLGDVRRAPSSATRRPSAATGDAARPPLHRRRPRLRRSRVADYGTWAPTSRRAAGSCFHDVFADPAEGGRPPYGCVRGAVSDGSSPASSDRVAARAAALTLSRGGGRRVASSRSISAPASISSSAASPAGSPSRRNRPAVGPDPPRALAARANAAKFQLGCSTGNSSPSASKRSSSKLAPVQ